MFPEEHVVVEEVCPRHGHGGAAIVMVLSAPLPGPAPWGNTFLLNASWTHTCPNAQSRAGLMGCQF